MRVKLARLAAAAGVAISLTGGGAAAETLPPGASPFGLLIYGGGEYMLLFRHAGGGTRDLVRHDPSGAIVLRTDDPDLGTRSGARFFGGFTWDGVNHIEGAYFFVSTYHGRASTALGPGEPFTAIFINPADFGGFEIAARIRVEVRSHLQGFEANYRRALGPIFGSLNASVLAGFRHINLREEMVITSEDEFPSPPGDFGEYSIRVRNRMYGGQIGAILEHPLPGIVQGLGVRLDTKVGFFANRASQDTFIRDSEDDNRAAGAASRTRFSTMVEAGLRLVWQPHPALSIHGGYQVIFIQGVALAKNQTGTPTNFNGLNTSSHVIYHGPVAGLTLRY